jgi:hypothetical protein
MTAVETHSQGDGINIFASPRNWRTKENIVWNTLKIEIRKTKSVYNRQRMYLTVFCCCAYCDIPAA